MPCRIPTWRVPLGLKLRAERSLTMVIIFILANQRHRGTAMHFPRDGASFTYPVYKTSLEPCLEGRRHRTLKDSYTDGFLCTTSGLQAALLVKGWCLWLHRDSSSLLLTAVWTDSCVPYRILLWAAVSEMSRREGIWEKDDRRQSLEARKAKNSPGWKVFQREPRCQREPVLTRAPYFHPVAGRTCWPLSASVYDS